MISRIQTVSILICAVLAAVAAQTEVTDDAVADAVRDELRFDPGVSSQLLTVTVEDGIVTMTGDVGSLLEADRAILLAETIRGVRGVVDEMTIRPVTRSDAEITADLREAFRMDPVADAMQLEVRVEEGTVHLTGTVNSLAERDLVERVTKTVKGVRGVQSELEVSIDPERPDDEIKAEIWKRLRFDPYVQGTEIDVTVDNGVATLEGTVRSLPVYRRVIRQAMVTGVTDITSIGLIVDPAAGRPMKRDSISVAMPDSSTENAVTSILENQPETPRENIRVESSDGVVYLYGMVNNLRARNMAGEAARNTVGVREVRNFVQVRPTGGKTDKALAADVAHALRWNPYLERFALTVHVRNNKAYLYGIATDPAMGKTVPEVNVKEGVVMVGGTVPSHGQRELMISNVKSVRGVREIHDSLHVNLDNTRSDEQIAQEVRRRFELNPYIHDLLVKVEVDEGFVRLSGTVRSAHGMAEARRLANVAGVRSVDDSNLKVRFLAQVNRAVGREPIEFSDSTLRTRILDVLRYDSRTSAVPIEVSVDGGRVVLTGRVNSLAAKSAAEEDVQNTVGVRMVRNLIRVRPDSVRKDRQIAEDVRAVLAIDPLISTEEITVQVRNGNAHLYGTVGSPIDVARAGRAASSVVGVSEITNTLRPGISRPAVTDRELEDALEEAFLWSPYVDPEHVTARIQDGVVTLEGRVTSWRQLYTAVRLSLEAGAFEVRSRLIHDGVSEYFPVFHYEDYSYRQ